MRKSRRFVYGMTGPRRRQHLGTCAQAPGSTGIGDQRIQLRRRARRPGLPRSPRSDPPARPDRQSACQTATIPPCRESPKPPPAARPAMRKRPRPPRGAPAPWHPYLGAHHVDRRRAAITRWKRRPATARAPCRFFTRNSNQWAAKPLDDEAIRAFFARADARLGPFEMAAHDSLPDQISPRPIPRCAPDRWARFLSGDRALRGALDPAACLSSGRAHGRGRRGGFASHRGIRARGDRAHEGPFRTRC